MSALAVPTSVRRCVLLVWLLAALSLLLRAAVAAPLDRAGSGRPVLEIVWFDPADVLPFRSERVARELRSTLSDIDLRISWREAHGDATASAHEYLVILLREDPVATRRARRVMGVVERGDASRSIWIFFSAIKDVLGVDPDYSSFAARQRGKALARTMGRILAHELVHLIAPGRPHAKAGLMRPRLRLEDLAAPWPLRLDPRFSAAVLRGLRLPAPSLPRLLAVSGSGPAPPVDKTTTAGLP
jgi:predicted metallopeptidase